MIFLIKILNIYEIIFHVLKYKWIISSNLIIISTYNIIKNNLIKIIVIHKSLKFI